MKERAEAEAEEKAKQAEEEERLKRNQCSSCKKPIMDNNRKPLYLYDKKVCSSKCAQELRRHLHAEAAEKRFMSLS